MYVNWAWQLIDAFGSSKSATFTLKSKLFIWSVCVQCTSNQGQTKTIQLVNQKSTFDNSKKGNSFSWFHSVGGGLTLIVTMIRMGNIFNVELWRISSDWDDFVVTTSYNLLATSIPCYVWSWNTSGYAGKWRGITHIHIYHCRSWRCCRRHWSNKINIPLELHVYSFLD